MKEWAAGLSSKQSPTIPPAHCGQITPPAAAEHLRPRPARQPEPEPEERLEAAAEARARTPSPLGDGAHAAVLARVQVQYAVRLAQADRAQHDRLCLVGTRHRLAKHATSTPRPFLP